MDFINKNNATDVNTAALFLFYKKAGRKQRIMIIVLVAWTLKALPESIIKILSQYGATLKKLCHTKEEKSFKENI
jgi:hypothetical protein